ncbi:MAG: alkaline phosphatase family protein [Flavisolibacter sp.]
MLRKSCFLPFLFSILISSSQTIKTPSAKWKKVLLPNGWSLTPAGKTLSLGDLPLNMALSESKRYLAVTNNGQSTQSIQVIDLKTEKITDNIQIPKSWYGLKFSEMDQALYASGGNDNWILKYRVINNKLHLEDSIILGKKWPEKISPAGFDIDEKRHLLYVVTKENNSLYIVDLKTKRTNNIIQLPAEGFTCMLSADKNELYISCWGCDKVIIINTWSFKTKKEITTGSHPNELCLSKKTNRLFVANANDNTVSVIDLKLNKVIETLNAALYPNAPTGSTTNGLALSEDERTLFVANADNNCLAVFDVSSAQSHSKGFIPVGWYPTNVKIVANKIYVTNGKGASSMANPFGPNPVAKNERVSYQNGDSTKPLKVQYIAGLFKGTLSIIDIPTNKQLAAYSAQVYANTPYTKKKEIWAGAKKDNPVPSKVGDISPIKHVFYIIKENRTYDQVLGDIKEGNGDPSLVLFGENITPNLHALAKEFVLLDNFYCDAEVSSDGHNWSFGAYATDFLEKTWPTDYGGRGGEYSGEGKRAIANNKNGFIWDYCKRSGVSYRTYGEFTNNYKASIPSLKDHVCPYYTGWDLSVKDTTRFAQWKREFDSLVVIDKVPQLNTMRFGNDHTEGLRNGKPTPFAHVADNDWAVGMFVDYLSHSKIWKESVVFIVEDDAQNGPDHVDAHRTTAYVAGGYIKRGYVDHTMYSTTSLLRTIELILGLPPMSQYDAAATPMWNSFTMTANVKPFISTPARIDLDNKNVVLNEWQRLSETFNLAKEDAVPDDQLNMVLWHGIKGDAPYPSTKRAAFVRNIENRD